jgi:RNA polymerase sigma factor (sigma-70 family)
MLRKTATTMSDDHEDVAQTALLKLLEVERAGKAGSIDAPSSYLSTMARNTTVDLIRWRRRFVSTSEPQEDASAEPDDADAWDDRVLSALRLYICSLRTDLAEVFSLRFVRELPQSAAARELGISRQNLRTLERHIKNGASAIVSSLG